MMPKILIVLLLFSVQGFSQSLTINETINYLNNLSINHPGTWKYHDDTEELMYDFDNCKNQRIYVITYDSASSKFAVQETARRYNCSTFQNFINRSLYTFDLNGFQITDVKLRMDEYGDRVEITGEIERVEFDTVTKSYPVLGRSTNYVSLFVKHKDYLKVYFNGIKYLVSLINQLIPKEKLEINDPFVHKTTEPKISKVNSESKIKLFEENGVANLNVTIGSTTVSKFILDSGAGECSMSSDLEKKLINNGIIKPTDYRVNGLYRLADGSVVENRRVNISKIKIGNKIVHNVIISIGASNSPNLLGQSFLKKLDKWSIDNSAQLLIIQWFLLPLGVFHQISATL